MAKNATATTPISNTVVQSQDLSPERRAILEAAIPDFLALGYRNWTPQTIRQASDTGVMYALRVINLDTPELTTRIAPEGMPLSDYHHMVLREMDRRNLFDRFYLHEAVPPSFGERSEIANQNVNRILEFIRPDFAGSMVGADTGSNRNIRVTPMQTAIYDASVSSILFDQPLTVNGVVTPANPAARPGVVLRDDVVQALRLPPAPQGEIYAATVRTDTARATLGYALGAVDAFNPYFENPQMIVRMSMPGPDGQPRTFDQVQPEFCHMVRDMYREGEQQDPRNAFIQGFMQSRIDQRNPNDTNPAVGLTGPCPPVSTPATPPVARTGTQR